MEDMASVHLSISKHSQLSSLSTGREVIPFFFSSLQHRPLSSPHFCFTLLLQPFLQSHLSTPHLSFHILPPLAFIFFFFSPFPTFSCFSFFHSTLLLAIPSFLLCSSPSPVLSVEQPIQQQNKAAYSITHWLIKQDQNSASLRSTQQHHDTGLHWRGEVSHIKRCGSRRKENVDTEKAEGNKYAPIHRVILPVKFLQLISARGDIATVQSVFTFALSK